MSKDRINHWLQIGGNVGIIASLLLVGFQLKQNADLLSTELLYEESNRSIELESRVIGENGAAIWAKAMTTPRELTLEEQRVMEALYWSYLEGLRATRMLAEKGLLDDDEWRQRIDVEVPFYFGNAYGKSWWNSYINEGPSGLQPDLFELISQSINEYHDNWTLEYVKGTVDRLPD